MPEETIPFTVRYPASSLERLKTLQDQTQVSGREWFRALLEALLETYEKRGHVELPLAVLPKRDAERAGLLKR